MKESFVLKEIFAAKPSEVYEAWLDSTKHSKMIDGEAECTSTLGGTFSIWEGYIVGSNLELIPNTSIIQSWRASEFKQTDEDSRLTIHLKEVNDGTEFILEHTHIPQGQTQYKQGWLDYYLEPMKSYFNNK